MKAMQRERERQMKEVMGSFKVKNNPSQREIRFHPSQGNIKQNPNQKEKRDRNFSERTKPPSQPSMSEKQFCMLLKISIDCNSCCKKLRRIISSMKAIESYLIEKERYRVSVCGRFAPADIAIKIRKKMNRRVEILDVEEIEMEADAPNQNQADQNPPPPSFPNLNPNPNQISMFPSLDNHNRRPIFPSLANECRSFSSSRPDFTITYFPDSFGIGDMPESFWHY